MKKSILIAFLLATGNVLAGETTTIGGPIDPILQPVEVKTYTLSIQGGIMHTGADSPSMIIRDLQGGVSRNLNTELVPTILYGINMSLEKNLTNPGESRFFQSIGLSVGYYTGSKSDQFSFQMDYNDYVAKSDADFDATVDMIPIVLTYNLQYEVTESLYVYAGVRGGAVIRRTDIDGANAWFRKVDNLFEDETENYDKTSTKVLPTVGLGVGMRAYMTDNLAFDLSYDLNWSFGDDCDDIEGSMGTVLPGTTESSRYFGTVKAGFSYSF